MNYDLIIVGLGPVGATAANLAGLWGLNALVIADRSEVAETYGAVRLDHETKRVLQNICITSDIEKHLIPCPTVVGSAIKSATVFTTPTSAWSTDPIVPTRVLEQAAIKRLKSYGSIRLAQQKEIIAVHLGASGIAVQLQDSKGREEVAGKYLLLCDGTLGNHRLRSMCGIADLRSGHCGLVVEVLLDNQPSEQLHFNDYQYREMALRSTAIIHAQRHLRFLVNHLDLPSDEITENHIHHLLAPWLGRDEYTLCDFSAFQHFAPDIGSQKDSRVFMLGDGARSYAPFMGKAICDGILDAFNLIWKIALVVNNFASENFLDTYEEERFSSARKDVSHTASGTMTMGAETFAAVDGRRAEVVLGGSESPGANPSNTLSHQIHHGFLINRPTDPTQGRLFPQLTVKDVHGQTSMLDNFSKPAFRLVYTAGVNIAPVLSSIASWTNRKGFPLALIRLVSTSSELRSLHDYWEPDGALRNWMRDHNSQITLVRPDHYVYGSATSPNEGVLLVEAMNNALRARPAF